MTNSAAPITQPELPERGLKAFFKQWLVKFFEREAYIPMILIIISTIALFTGMCVFQEWAWASGSFVGVALSAITVRKIGTKQ
jgi:hypothetical protein